MFIAWASFRNVGPDGMPCSAASHLQSTASHLGLFCLPMSHKRDARLKEISLKNEIKM